MVHLFWECPTVKACDMCLFIINNIDENFVFFWKNVLFGFIRNVVRNTNGIFLIDLIIIMAKFHIHKSKFAGRPPHFTAFNNEFKQYICSIRLSKKPKAIKTITACDQFNVFK